MYVIMDKTKLASFTRKKSLGGLMDPSL